MADKGGGINANAMYQAGLASRAEVNTKQEAAKERKREFWGGVAKEAYNILGTAAVGQIKSNYKQYQKMSNAQESNSANVLLEIKKFPKDNEALVQDLADLKAKHAAATKTATLGFGKKRSKAKAAASMYLQQLKDFDLWLKGVAENRLDAQGMTSVGAGTTQGSAEQGGMSPAANGMEEGNTVEFALGGIHQRLRWNSETGQGEVQVGGEWLKDKASGKQKYSDKAETGTYEDYAAENSKMKKKLFDKFKASSSSNFSYEEWESTQGESIAPMSREEWTNQNQGNRGLVSNIPYSQMKFAKKEDKIVGDNIMLLDVELAKQAMKKDSVSWEFLSETQNGKKQFAGTINSYTNAQFKDFFFGGFSFDYANDRMAETAPAYILLKEDPMFADQLDDEGNFKEGFGPGSVDWEGRLLALKGQSFVKGSIYRQQVIDQQWGIRKEKYEANQKAYKDANPEDPQWKKDGYANKKQYLDALKANSGDADEDDIGDDIEEGNPYGFDADTVDNDEISIGDDDGTYTVEQANLLLDKVKNGIKFEFGGMDYNYIDNAWHGFKPGQDINTPRDNSLIGTSGELESKVFKTDLDAFKTVETVVSSNVKLDNKGEPLPPAKPTINPFDTKKIPEDFITAVGKDDNNVIAYIKGLNQPNLTIKEGYNNDTIVIGIGEKPNRKVKQFTVDPNVQTDKKRAEQIWNWMKKNYVTVAADPTDGMSDEEIDEQIKNLKGE